MIPGIYAAVIFIMIAGGVALGQMYAHDQETLRMLETNRAYIKELSVDVAKLNQCLELAE